MKEILSTIQDATKPTTILIIAVGSLPPNELIELATETAKLCEAALPNYSPVVLAQHAFSVDSKDPLTACVRGYVLRDLLVDTGNFLRKQGFRNVICVSADLTPKHLTAIQEATFLLWRRNRLKRFSLLSPSALIAQLPKLTEISQAKSVLSLIQENSAELKAKIKKGFDERTNPIKLFRFSPAILPWNSSYWSAWILTFLLGTLLVAWAMMAFSVGIDL